MHLCLALSVSLLKYLIHTLHSTDPVSCCCLWTASADVGTLPLICIAYHMFLLCTATNQPAPTSRTDNSPFTTSLYCLLGSRCGCVFGSHVKRAVLGMCSSGILTRCPNHSSHRLITLEVTVSSSSHLALRFPAVIPSSQYLLCEIPSAIRYPHTTVHDGRS